MDHNKTLPQRQVARDETRRLMAEMEREREIAYRRQLEARLTREHMAVMAWRGNGRAKH